MCTNGALPRRDRAGGGPRTRPRGTLPSPSSPPGGRAPSCARVLPAGPTLCRLAGRSGDMRGSPGGRERFYYCYYFGYQCSITAHVAISRDPNSAEHGMESVIHPNTLPTNVCAAHCHVPRGTLCMAVNRVFSSTQEPTCYGCAQDSDHTKRTGPSQEGEDPRAKERGFPSVSDKFHTWKFTITEPTILGSNAQSQQRLWPSSTQH